MKRRYKGSRPVCLGLAALLLTTIALPLRAIQYGAWVTYHRRGEESVDRYARAFRSIAVFAYEFDAAESLVPATPWVDEELAALQANRPGTRLHLATIVNDSQTDFPKRKRGDIVLAILSDATRRAAHIQQLTQIAQRADGLVIDYEALPAAVRGPYTQFVQELRAALPPGKKLFLAVEPKTDLAVGSGGRAIDWAAVAPSVDALIVMAYYFRGSGTTPGPAATVADLGAILTVAYQQLALPKAKVHIALTHFGTDWSSSGTNGLVSYPDMVALGRLYGAQPQRDPGSENWRLLYQDREGATHEIWVDDAQSLRTKIAYLDAQGVPQVHFWHLGVGDPSFWSGLGGPSGPSVARLVPAAFVSGAPGALLDAEGNDFDPGSVLLWNGSARQTAWISAGAVTATIPDTDLAQPGIARVAIQNPNGLRSTERSIAVVSPGPVALTSVTPASVIAGRLGFFVRLDGQGFNRGTSVEWNGRPLQTLYIGPQRLSAFVPFDAVAYGGTATLRARQASGELSNGLSFIVNGQSREPGQPASVMSLSRLFPPDTQAGLPRLTVRFYGQGFAPGSRIVWDGREKSSRWLATDRLEVDLTASDIASPGTIAGWILDPSATQRSDTFHFTVTTAAASDTTNVSNVFARPNPWHARRDPPVMTWEGLVPGADVKIFNVAGQHVRTIKAASTQAFWDLRTAGGEPAASGYYFYLVNFPSGRQHRGKIALIR